MSFGLYPARLLAVLSGCSIRAHPACEGAQGQDQQENPGRIVGAAGVVYGSHHEGSQGKADLCKAVGDSVGLAVFFSAEDSGGNKRRRDGADGISQAEKDGHDVEHADILPKQDEDKGKGKGDASKGSAGHNAELVIEPSQDQLSENTNHGIHGDNQSLYPGALKFLDGRREVAQGAGINQSVAQHAEDEKKEEQLCPGFLHAEREYNVSLFRVMFGGSILDGGIPAAVG